MPVDILGYVEGSWEYLHTSHRMQLPWLRILPADKAQWGSPP